MYLVQVITHHLRVFHFLRTKKWNDFLIESVRSASTCYTKIVIKSTEKAGNTKSARHNTDVDFKEHMLWLMADCKSH